MDVSWDTWELGTKTHFAKLTHILPLKKAWGCCYKGLFLLSPSPLSSVDCVELKLECITSALHRRGRGEGRCLNLTSYCVSVSRVLTRVVVRNRISFCNLVCRIVRFALSIVLYFPIPSLPWQLYLSQMENICSSPSTAHIRTIVVFTAWLKTRL